MHEYTHLDCQDAEASKHPNILHMFCQYIKKYVKTLVRNCAERVPVPDRVLSSNG